MARNTLKETLVDKDFQGLPDVEKRKYLAAKFPDFSLLPALEQNKVLAFKEPSFGRKVADRMAGGFFSNMLEAPGELIGAGKGLATTLRSAGNLATLGGERNLTPEQRAFLDKITTAKGSAQERGKFIEQAGEFILPEGAGVKLAKGASFGARSALEAAKSGAISGFQTGFKPTEMLESAGLGGAGPALGATTKFLGRFATDILGMKTGVGGEVIRTAALDASKLLKSAMRGGIDEIQIAKDVRSAVEKVADARGAAYRTDLADIDKKMAGKTLDVVKPVMGDLLKTLKSQWGIPARRTLVRTPAGKLVPGPLRLDFTNSTLATNPGEQNRIRTLVRTLEKWSDNSALGVDRLKQTVDNLYKESSAARPLVQGAKDQIRSMLNDKVPGYAKMTKDYAQATKFLDEINKEFSIHGGTGTLVRKVFPNALNQNNEYRKIMIEALGQAAGVDLKGEIAGGALRSLMPRGLVARGFLGAAMEGLEFLSGANPLLKAITGAEELLTSSPRAVGEIMAMISAVQRNPAIRAGATAAGLGARGAGLAHVNQPAQPEVQQ